MNLVTVLISGVLFGFGLALSGMTDVGKVIGFLDVTGSWDPSLIFVMGGGLLVTTPVFQLLVKQMSRPLLAKEFNIPQRTDVSFDLIIGAATFGVGWGLVGLCPGPAIASLAYMNEDVLLFAVCMVAGLFLGESINRKVFNH